MNTRLRDVFIFRSLGFSSDARMARNAFPFSNEHPIHFVCWGNEERECKDSSFHLPRFRGAVFYMALGYVCFSIYIVAFVLRHVRKGDVCIFMDLETAFPAIFLSKLLGAFSVFDIVDPFSFVKPVRPRYLFNKLEEYVANKASLVFVPNEMRRSPYKNQLAGATVLVVENVPSFETSVRPPTFVSHISKGSIFTLGYFGGLESKHRGLEDILSLVIKNNHLRLIIAGSGDLENYIQNATMQCERIIFIGAFKYNDLPSLVNQVDIMVGLYYQTKELHRYASPNKYYEHFYFGKPLLTSSGTPFAKTVCELKSGWVVEDGFELLNAWAGSLTSECVVQCAKSAWEAWHDLYDCYYQNKKLEFGNYFPYD